MAAKMKMKKASKGKTGCLKQNGRLKKGWKWSKSRKGYCQPAKSAKKPAKKAGKKGGRKSAARSAAAKRAAAKRLVGSEAYREKIMPVERTIPSAGDAYAARGKFTEEELKSFGALGRMRRR